MKAIVIFGATGDLCKRKVIPALHELFQRNLLPENFLIVASSRRDPGTKSWTGSLGDYPEDFLQMMD